MKQRDIVLVPFPFTDQSGQKVRPALILSNDRFNSADNDIVICAITSNPKPTHYSLSIREPDIETGMLYSTSIIKTPALLKINKHLALKTIARLKKQAFAKVIMQLSELFRQR